MILILLSDSIMYIKLFIVLSMSISAKMICGSVKLLIKKHLAHKRNFFTNYTKLVALYIFCCVQSASFCNKKMSFCIILHAQTFFYQTVIQANKNNNDKIHFFCCDTVDSVAEQWHQYSILDFFFYFTNVFFL